MIRLMRTATFVDYPDAQQFIDQQLRRGRGCSLVVSNEGFVVDVYANYRQVH